MRETRLEYLLARYDTLLLDAYGVLVDNKGPLPGAVALIDQLNRQQRPYFILTNSASRLPESMAADFAAIGLAIPAERIITSGSLLAALFSSRGLSDARCLTLGPSDALRYVERAGAEALLPGQSDDAEVVVIADQKGFDLQQGLDQTVSLLLRRFDQGLSTTLLLCNPDLIYPAGPSQYGITAGAIAAMIDSVLQERYPSQPPRFEPIGKPHSALFNAAKQYSEGPTVMLGDQLGTDILGAQRAGIASALVLSGLTRQPPKDAAIIPDYVLGSLQD